MGNPLSVYPIDAEKPLVVQWGYDKLEGNDLIVRIEIGPKNSLGELIARVEIADDHDPSKRIRTSFRTGYTALEMFERDIAKLMERDSDAATLLGQ